MSQSESQSLRAKREEIEGRRNRLGLNKCDMARAAGVAARNYRRFSNGHGGLSWAMLDKLTEALDRLELRQDAGVGIPASVLKACSRNVTATENAILRSSLGLTR